MLGEGGVHHAVAQPPARHGVGLGETVEEDRPLRHIRPRGDRLVRSLVKDLSVDLVREHEDLAIPDEGSDVVEIARRQDRSGRVVRGVQDQHARARRQERLDVGRAETEAAILAERQGNRLSARETDLRFVDRKARIRDDHLVARIDAGEDGEG